MSLILTSLKKFPFIKPGDPLGKFIINSLKDNEISLQNGDILVIAQKIVSKAEGRLRNLKEITPSAKASEIASFTGKDPRFVEVVLSESNTVLRTRQNTIIVEHKNGFICANAGVDHSNVRGEWGDDSDWVLLLPEDADQSATKLRVEIEAFFNVKIGVLIIDSHGRAWRNGIVGTTIGLSGLPALVDLRGTKDLFDYQLKVTQVAAADELAAGASLLMGQASEGTPVIHVRGFPYPMSEGKLQDLIRPVEQDLFR